jgi:hypothetical protein
VAGEEANMVTVPSWGAEERPDDPTLHLLAEALLATLGGLGPGADLRPHTAAVAATVLRAWGAWAAAARPDVPRTVALLLPAPAAPALTAVPAMPGHEAAANGAAPGLETGPAERAALPAPVLPVGAVSAAAAAVAEARERVPGELSGEGPVTFARAQQSCSDEQEPGNAGMRMGEFAHV